MSPKISQLNAAGLRFVDTSHMGLSGQNDFPQVLGGWAMDT